MRRTLHAPSLQYRVQAAGLPGPPDLAFNRARVAVFDRLQQAGWEVVRLREHDEPAKAAGRVAVVWRRRLRDTRPWSRCVV